MVSFVPAVVCDLVSFVWINEGVEHASCSYWVVVHGVVPSFGSSYGVADFGSCAVKVRAAFFDEGGDSFLVIVAFVAFSYCVLYVGVCCVTLIAARLTFAAVSDWGASWLICAVRSSIAVGSAELV